MTFPTILRGRTLPALTLAIALALTACGDDGPVDTAPNPEAADAPTEAPTDEPTTEAPTDDEPASADSVTLLTHDSFNVSEEVLAAFEEESGITVEILRGGDAGQMVNQAILSRDNPQADVLFGIDNTFLSRALEADLFEPYTSPALEAVPDQFVLDAEHRVTPIDFGDVCLNYDAEALSGDELPTSLQDLTDPRFEDMLVVENPATSSPGLAFLLATVDEFGEDGWLEFWANLRDNGVEVSPGWEEAYYSVFSGASGEGDRPLVVSYASSPPAEVYFAEQTPEQAPTGVIAESCFRQIEFAGILANTDAPDAARQLVDFLLSETFQEDIPLQMFVFPVLPDAELPEEFTEYTVIPDDPLQVPYDVIGENREEWIEQWTDTVIR